MNTEKTIDTLSRLGNLLKSMPPDQVAALAETAANENNWFTPENVKSAMIGATNYLNAAKLNQWMSSYSPVRTPQVIGLVMAGNIPLVGLHDLLSVLMSGHMAHVKPSSKDSVLLTFFMEKLTEIDPELASRVQLVDRLQDIDAIIATGSDNTARYFHHYFGKYPNIIRKNRTSLALLRGNESERDLYLLGKDIFTYFGLGCRNVSKLLVPEGYRFDTFYESIAPFSNVMEHNRYHNNYDYNKSILLVNKVTHLDNGFLLLREAEELVSPISVLFYSHYKDEEELRELLGSQENKIQCLVSEGGWYPGSIAMGQSQMPELWDYADNVDTMKFLCSL